MEGFGGATKAARADLACEEKKKKQAVGDDGSLRGVVPVAPWSGYRWEQRRVARLWPLADGGRCGQLVRPVDLELES